MIRYKKDMFKTKILGLILFMSIFNQMQSQDIFSNTFTDSLWNITVQPYLAEPLWKTETSYNAGHFLMIPMYAAFEKNNYTWKIQFAQQFQRFSDSGNNDMSKTLLYRIQYIYLASEFINLCVQYHNEDLIPPKLYEQLYNHIESTWMKDKIWNWSHPNYRKLHFNSMRTKVIWKLYNNVINEKTYHTCILDEEFFTIATGANLKRYLLSTANINDGILDDMVQIGLEAYKKRVVFSKDGGWTIQPGYWMNYADFVYAGNKEVQDTLEKKPVPNIAEDFSHSLRYPCWINSMMNAYEPYSDNYNFYLGLKAGLATQLFSKILVAPSDSNPDYMATNYMDGNNGVYRFKYNGRKGGINPYGLTGSIQVGWWSFLDSERVNAMYEFIALSSKLNLDNKIYLYKNISERTYKYLICILASQRKAQLY